MTPGFGARLLLSTCVGFGVGWGWAAASGEAPAPGFETDPQSTEPIAGPTDPAAASPRPDAGLPPPRRALRLAPGPEAARLRSRILRLEAEIACERALQEEEARVGDDPLAALPSFDDDRIPPEHRPEGFGERMDAARKWLAEADLDREVRLSDVDCSALPCIAIVISIGAALASMVGPSGELSVRAPAARSAEAPETSK